MEPIGSGGYRTRFESAEVLSVGELLSKAIKYIHSEQSVSSLFEQ